MFESAACTGGAPRLFFATEDHTVTIHDLRRAGLAPALDREGFELRSCASQVVDFYDDATITRVYYPEIESFLTERLGACRVVVFDVTRRSDAESGASNADGARQPARRVHVDYTQKSGPQRVRDVLGAGEAERFARAGARIVQLNVWRPIHGPVLRSPLAVADAGSIRPESLVATDQIFPDRVGEIYHVAYDSRQRWYYVPRMRSDEVLLIKGWDSLDDGRARFTPHGAFTWALAPPDAPPRESIEVRTLAVFA
ncbi:MAG: methyltransferase [Nevskiaceae bacterium]|nr:MAG: methyltransferase [Nevskiaceae bacterium]TBR73271.1 MAG: methyltransferase [Nevskiaceae bacterium]